MSKRKLDAKVTERPEALMITVAGNLDDQSAKPLADLADKLRSDARPLVFDLAEVAFINSYGTREWSSFLKQLKQPKAVERCSSYFIECAIITPELVGNAKLVSLFLPFECRSCNHSFEDLRPFSDVKTKGASLAGNCPKCNVPAEAMVSGSDLAKLGKVVASV